MAAALAHHFDVVPITKIADLDAVARVRKRDRVVFHSANVPQMFTVRKVSTMRQRCLLAIKLSYSYAPYGTPSSDPAIPLDARTSLTTHRELATRPAPRPTNSLVDNRSSSTA